jgi:small-conductance mechanosensitive channel
VTHLSKAQLARKRANDREAQRNIRQRAKEHIESLEKKVQELETGRSSSMARALKRNQELVAEIEKFRAHMPSVHKTPSQIPSEISDELFAQPKHELNWMSYLWPGAVPSHIPALNSNADSPVSMAIPASTYSNNGPIYPITSSPMGFDRDLNTPTVTPIWDDPLVFSAL